jgi:hypothetical protein
MEHKPDGPDCDAPLTVTEKRLLARKFVNAKDDYASADRIARQRQAEAEAEFQRRMAAREAHASVLKSMRDNRLQQSTAHVVRQEALGRLSEVFQTVKPIMERDNYKYDGERFGDDGKFCRQDMLALDLEGAVEHVTGEYLGDVSDELGR